MREVLGGKYTTSLHWESKADAVKYIKPQLPSLWKKMSLIYVGTHVTNPFLIPKKYPRSGEYVMVLPTVKTCRFPIINATTSVGPFIRARPHIETRHQAFVIQQGQLLDR